MPSSGMYSRPSLAPDDTWAHLQSLLDDLLRWKERSVCKRSKADQLTSSASIRSFYGMWMVADAPYGLCSGTRQETYTLHTVSASHRLLTKRSPAACKPPKRQDFFIHVLDTGFGGRFSMDMTNSAASKRRDSSFNPAFTALFCTSPSTANLWVYLSSPPLHLLVNLPIPQGTSNLTTTTILPLDFLVRCLVLKSSQNSTKDLLPKTNGLYNGTRSGSTSNVRAPFDGDCSRLFRTPSWISTLSGAWWCQRPYGQPAKHLSRNPSVLENEHHRSSEGCTGKPLPSTQQF